jgi:hypothetical protein
MESIVLIQDVLIYNQYQKGIPLMEYPFSNFSSQSLYSKSTAESTAEPTDVTGTTYDGDQNKENQDDRCTGFTETTNCAHLNDPLSL